MNKYEVKVGQFDRLNVSDNVNVIYRCKPDSTGYAAWIGEQRFDDAFIFSVKKGKLIIQVNTDDVNDPKLPTIVVYSDFLTSVVSSSDKRVTIFSPKPSSSFKAELIGNGTLSVNGLKVTKLKGVLNTGNGTLILSGECSQATLNLVGAGTIQADELKATEVKCKIFGGGTIGCWPTVQLNSSGVGSTKVYYKGDPKIKKSGGGKLIKLQSGKPVQTE